MNSIDHPVTDEARARFAAALTAIERDRGVRVLHACESGSRAWGFASPDSDYDVRFIYAHPRDWYLSVFERRDVIELPLEGDEDINGWDLRKALRLLAKSNPVLIEWLQSPIVYRQQPGFGAAMLALAQQLYSPAAGHYHYFSMARNNYREHLLGEAVKLKKYFYVLRPVLACQWIERGWGMPPMAFMELAGRLLPEGPLLQAIVELRRRKMLTVETGMEPRVPLLHAFLEGELERLGRNAPPGPQEPIRHEALDAFLREWAAPG